MVNPRDGVPESCGEAGCVKRSREVQAMAFKYLRRMQPRWGNTMLLSVKPIVLTRHSWKIDRQILGCCKRIDNMQKCDWMELTCQLLNFYRTDSNAIFNIVIASLFYIIISKPMPYLCDDARANKCFITFKAECWPSLFKSLVPSAWKQKWATNSPIALPEKKALLKLYKNSDPNPSGIRDLTNCSYFEVQKGSEIA